MSFTPNATMGRPTPAFVAWPYVDTLYDHTQLLGSHESIVASLPATAQGKSVAIVGAGIAGLVAAYELLKAGLSPVVFEATGRLGGRCWSRPFTDEHGSPVPAFAEMGAMRVPLSAKVFFHYARELGMTSTTFPDPGLVPTLLHYEGCPYFWNPGEPPPGPFARIARDWNAFVHTLTDAIYQPWREGDWARVARTWQTYIDRYKNMNFLEAVARGIPFWTAEDINAFGALGLGSGGFGSLYEIGFLELLRIVVNQWEREQQLFQQGMSAFAEGLHARRVESPAFGTTSLKQQGAVMLNTPVTGIEYGADKNPIVTLRPPGSPAPERRSFPAVILATTTRAMEMIGLTLPGEDGVDLVTQPVKVAVRNLHLIESSKMFIRTRTKFWRSEPGMPQTIQTDELPRGVYALDYPQTENGVVLLSYTWGDDSTKLLGLELEERFAKFKEVLSLIHPGFARQLVPVNGEVVSVDWQAEPYHYGAFKLQHPGQEPHARDAYYQFLTVLDPEADRGVYLAGDSVSWSGGWVEGAMQTGLNAASAAAKRLGCELPPSSPLSQDPHRYRY